MVPPTSRPISTRARIFHLTVEYGILLARETTSAKEVRVIFSRHKTFAQAIKTCFCVSLSRRSANRRKDAMSASRESMSRFSVCPLWSSCAFENTAVPQTNLAITSSRHDPARMGSSICVSTHFFFHLAVELLNNSTRTHYYTATLKSCCSPRDMILGHGPIPNANCIVLQRIIRGPQRVGLRTTIRREWIPRRDR